MLKNYVQILLCYCAVVYIINQFSVDFQLLFHCPSEAFKLCIIVKNDLPCYDVAFNKFWKQNDEDFVTSIAKRKIHWDHFGKFNKSFEWFIILFFKATEQLLSIFPFTFLSFNFYFKPSKNFQGGCIFMTFFR